MHSTPSQRDPRSWAGCRGGGRGQRRLSPVRSHVREARGGRGAQASPTHVTGHPEDAHLDLTWRRASLVPPERSEGPVLASSGNSPWRLEQDRAGGGQTGVRRGGVRGPVSDRGRSPFSWTHGASVRSPSGPHDLGRRSRPIALLPGPQVTQTSPWRLRHMAPRPLGAGGPVRAFGWPPAPSPGQDTLSVCKPDVGCEGQRWHMCVPAGGRTPRTHRIVSPAGPQHRARGQCGQPSDVRGVRPGSDRTAHGVTPPRGAWASGRCPRPPGSSSAQRAPRPRPPARPPAPGPVPSHDPQFQGRPGYTPARTSRRLPRFSGRTERHRPKSYQIQTRTDEKTLMAPRSARACVCPPSWPGPTYSSGHCPARTPSRQPNAHPLGARVRGAHRWPERSELTQDPPLGTLQGIQCHRLVGPGAGRTVLGTPLPPRTP